MTEIINRDAALDLLHQAATKNRGSIINHSLEQLGIVWDGNTSVEGVNGLIPDDSKVAFTEAAIEVLHAAQVVEQSGGTHEDALEAARERALTMRGADDTEAADCG